MKGRAIAIDDGDAALLVDGRLEDLILWSEAPMTGDIMRATVARTLPKGAGAFLDLGDGRPNGWLRGAAPDGAFLVQVTGVAEAGKAIPVSDRVLYKGRFLILTPGAPGVNLSRALKKHPEAERLLETARSAVETAAGDGDGFIVRTAATAADREAFAEEARILTERRAAAEETGHLRRTPAEVALTEWWTPETDIIERDGGFDRLGGAFDAFGISDQIEALRGPRSDLPSGGWITIEPSAALVSIDVNTGGDFSPAAALKANLEAAREIPRQLRLRGFGGQVVVDFAPVAKKERRRVEDALKTAFRRDPVETSLAGWTPLGLYELSRKRERTPLSFTAV